MDQDEKVIRDALSQQLGVEFYEEEELKSKMEVQGIVGADHPQKPEKAAGHIGKMSVSDLITQCNEATKRMSNKNPHKALIWNCAFVIRQLVERLDKLETKVN